MTDRTEFRNIFLLPSRFQGPAFILPSHPDQLNDIQQIIQGIGAVPELMLLPEAGGYRSKQELIHIRTAYGEVAGASGGDFLPPSPKKPDRLQEMLSMVRRRQESVSCSSSGQDQAEPCITGW